ncbi:polysaccharide deacetylase family protein [Halobacillus shinanisalinarum]|uniref:Polysaccharide deacetylase family protein n=1 Tax=Halobacillus shinanisalinarum TaxID=2932258 RepID=A0ABY4H432_9BACI|nr:polysaccharide deacetylase family protein [Halobacillus shinanisalinarum]UOQ95215.1 polysaccharide deacetylase family protein [Halobacillus shinanisalinarum]
MKRLNVYIALLSLLLILTACSFFIADANERSDKVSSESSNHYDVMMESEIEEYESYQITIHYPQTPNDQIDQIIIDYVNQKKDSFKKKSYEAVISSENKSAHELHIDYEVLYQDSEVFVVRFVEKTDIGQDQNVTRTIMNFNKSNGKRLELKNLFKSDTNYVRALAKETNQQLEVEKGFGTEVSKFDDLALMGDSLVVYITQEDQKKLNIKKSKVSIDKNALKNVLLPQYAKKVTPQVPDDDTISYPAIKTKQGPTKGMTEKLVAITFDNGPHKKGTPLVLDVLAEYDAKATFFMIGKRIKHYPETVREVAKQGHEIGNHTWDHSSFDRLPASEVKRQLVDTQQVIQDVTGLTTNLVRLPFGEGLPEAYESNFDVVPSTITPNKDWNLTNASEIAHYVTSNVEDGSIIMLSDLRPTTPKALKMILEGLSERGYSFVTVSELASR